MDAIQNILVDYKFYVAVAGAVIAVVAVIAPKTKTEIDDKVVKYGRKAVSFLNGQIEKAEARKATNG